MYLIMLAHYADESYPVPKLLTIICKKSAFYAIKIDYFFQSEVLFSKIFLEFADFFPGKFSVVGKNLLKI